jgi:hypothetical protein
MSRLTRSIQKHPRLVALMVAGLVAWPFAGQAVYVELVPGAVTAGSTYDDIRLLATGLIRLAMAFLALFAIIKGIQGYFEMSHTHGGCQTTMDNGWTTIQDSFKFVIMALVLSAVAPFAVNLMFDLASGQPLAFF